MYEKYIKRVLGLVLACIGIVVLSPVFIIVAILVRINLGSPIIFKQERPGKDEKIFTLYKFRTMIDVYDNEGNLLSDEQRLTKFGKWLRSTSLDELPELFNIVKGDMSFVGPRPLLVRYLPYYTNSERKRHNVRPGLTGYAQVNGRNHLTWDERLNYDIDYFNNLSLILDVSIMIKTVFKVIKKEGIDMGSLEDLDKYRKGG